VFLGLAAGAPAHADSAGSDPPPAKKPAAQAPATPDSLLPPVNSRVRLSMLPDSTSSGKRKVIIRDDDDDSDWRDENAWVSKRWRHKTHLTLSGRYTRIEGVLFKLGVRRHLSRSNYLPAYHATTGYAFAGQFGSIAAGFEQPLAAKNKLTLGAEGGRRFLSLYYGNEIISDGENSASLLIVKKEYRDWYEFQGGRAFVGVRPSPFVALKAGIRAGKEKSVPIAAGWSVFNQNDAVRPNPGITDGDYFGYFAEFGFDSRPRRSHTGPLYSRATWGKVEHWYRVSWQRSDPSVQEDFNEWKLTADLRTYFRIARRQAIWVRVLAGAGHGRSGTGGDLAAQRRFQLGGVGTLRGHNFKSVSGNNVILANVEYVFPIKGSVQAKFLMDVGNAWDRGSVFDQHIDVDLGTGIRIGEGGVSFILAKNLSDTNSDVRAVFRLQDTF